MWSHDEQSGGKAVACQWTGLLSTQWRCVVIFDKAKAYKPLPWYFLPPCCSFNWSMCLVLVHAFHSWLSWLIGLVVVRSDVRARKAQLSSAWAQLFSSPSFVAGLSFGSGLSGGLLVQKCWSYKTHFLVPVYLYLHLQNCKNRDKLQIIIFYIKGSGSAESGPSLGECR